MAALEKPTGSDLQELDKDHHLHPFTDHKQLHEKKSRIITHADGVYIFDADGNKILDGMSGLWCVNSGYGRDELVDAAAKQMRELPYYNSRSLIEFFLPARDRSPMTRSCAWCAVIGT